MSTDLPGIAPSAGSESDAPPSRRERRKLEVRARIVEAACALFEERGFDATTVQEIADRADVASGTFFNHFPTKLDLLRALSQEGVEELTREVEHLRKADLSTRERLRRLFAFVAAHIDDGRPRNRELLVEMVHSISADPGQRSAQASTLLTSIQGLIEEGLVRGDVTRRHDPLALTELILGAYYVLVFNYANLDDFPVRERAAAAADVLADALARKPEEGPEEEEDAG